MRHHHGIATLVALAGLCPLAAAQDSVSSSLGGLPGDGLDPWSQGCAAYVVDLAPITTSQGNVFGVAPILKASRMSSANFNALGSSVTISPDVLTGAAFTRSSYSVWSQAGAGVGPQNTQPSTVSPTGTASRFAVALSEFGQTDSGRSYNGIVGAMVAYRPSEPNRLYVDRRVAAVNLSGPTVGDSSQLGGVSIDANGNLYFRADNSGSTGPNQLTGNNGFRTRLADRDCGRFNLISTGGTLDATDWIVSGNATIHGVPSNIPASVVGGNGLYAGPNFNDQYVYGALAPTATNGHLAAGAPAHRGSFAMTQHQALGSGVYTLATSANEAGNGTARAINVWSVNASGAVVDKALYVVPLTVTDNENGFTVNYIAGVAQSRHHTGSTAYRGGVGTVAIGNDQAGRTLMATTISENGLNGDVSHQIVVGRFDNPQGPVEWTMAAYIDQFNLFTPNSGKRIYDADGNVIGQLVTLSQVNGSLTGPGMSAPAIDAAGNIWFMSSVELFDRLPGGGSDNDSALIRAVYDPDTFSYRLELVLELGTIAQGVNSDRPYRIDFLGTAAGSNTPAPNALWSSAVSDKAWNNASLAGVDPADPITNGGLVISTAITYDVDGDGYFNDPTSGFYNPARPADESYQVLLYVGYYADEAPCPADFNGDGQVNFFDVSAFIAAFNAQLPSADIAAPFGAWNFFDVSTFIGQFNAGCP